MSPGLPSVNPIMSLTAALLPGGMDPKDGWPTPNCRLTSECWPLPASTEQNWKDVYQETTDWIGSLPGVFLRTLHPFTVHLPITAASSTLMPERMGLPETDNTA